MSELAYDLTVFGGFNTSRRGLSPLGDAAIERNRAHRKAKLHIVTLPELFAMSPEDILALTAGKSVLTHSLGDVSLRHINANLKNFGKDAAPKEITVLDPTEPESISHLVGAALKRFCYHAQLARGGGEFAAQNQQIVDDTTELAHHPWASTRAMLRATRYSGTEQLALLVATETIGRVSCAVSPNDEFGPEFEAAGQVEGVHRIVYPDGCHDRPLIDPSGTLELLD